MPSFTRESGGTLHVAVMGVNRIGRVNSYDLEPGKPPIVAARINTVASQGVEVLEVDVQVQIASGVPAFTVVGLPDKVVAESRERVRAALGAIGLSLPPKRITVNLSPADVLKEGSHFDLPIAVGLLVSMGVAGAEDVAGFFVLGKNERRSDGELLSKVATPEVDGKDLLTEAAKKMSLSARGYHRVLRVARTLADLGASSPVRRQHVAEALSYRRLAIAGY